MPRNTENAQKIVQVVITRSQNDMFCVCTWTKGPFVDLERYGILILVHIHFHIHFHMPYVVAILGDEIVFFFVFVVVVFASA